MPRRAIAFSVVCLLLSVCVAACDHGHTSSPQLRAAQRFLDAVARGDVVAAAAATSDPVAARGAIAASLAGLGRGVAGTLHATSRSGDGVVSFSASWTVPGGTAPWSYQGQLKVVQQQQTWTVAWAPSDVHPKLSAGQHLQAVRVQPTRAALEDRNGRPLFTPTPVVQVGIQPSLVKNLPSLAATLARTLHISAADIVASVKAAPNPQAFVDVITLRRAAYEAVRPIIHPLDGTVFHTGMQLLAPTSRFGQPLLGQVGPATKDIIDASHGRIQNSDQTGRSGLQRVLDARLAGTVSMAVYAAAADGTLGAELGVAGSPRPGSPVRLTLDRAVQQAADAALQPIPQAAAIVALEPSSGRILAVANTAGTPGDIALAGQFPPGSTYKIVSATAALAGSPQLRPSTPLPCPGSTSVDGRIFVNEDRFDLGTVPLRTAFAMSCNTTFIQLGLQLAPDALGAAARTLGLGSTWRLPVESFSGSIPPPVGETEKAADAIGQGRVLVSPLAMTEVAGAAESGRPIAPSLVDGQQAHPGPALPAATATALRDMMRATVTSGRARALDDLPGGVAGKTGTAEYGTATPPRSHGWFAGYRGNLAFAVFIYDGQTSRAAVDVAHQFLAALH